MVNGKSEMGMNNKNTIKSFQGLDAWQEGHKLVLGTYKTTRGFPKHELYGLVSQMRRCVVSITSNIAEGFGRRTFPDKARFYSMARGSVTELHNQLIIAKDLAYVTDSEFKDLEQGVIRVLKIVTGLLYSALKRNN